MTSSYGHVLERQPAVLATRLESPGNLDSLQAKKNFSVSHLLDLEEAGDLVAAQTDESVGESGRSLLESPGLTSGSDTQQPDETYAVVHLSQSELLVTIWTTPCSFLGKNLEVICLF
uniref:Uncharacterized protein n=1 Tax=Laticauda laticaudata TaxID=8630 RepID=A0A8C5S7X4_LATLA